MSATTKVLRLAGSGGEDSRPEVMLTYACARQQRRGALARHRRQPLDPWSVIDTEDPDARELAHAWARGWERHDAVLTAVGRGAVAARNGESYRTCPYPATSDDEDESFLVKHWLFGWRSEGGVIECGHLAEVVPIFRDRVS
jgi:hypothetical protein